MLSLIARQCHQQLASLCLLFLLLGMLPSPGLCRRGVGADGGDDVVIERRAPKRDPAVFNRLLPIAYQNNTEEFLSLLTQRRLQEIEDAYISSNETDASAETQTPANGCTICQGNTFLPDKVPNQNFVPDLAGATCLEWQNVIFPTMFPTGENCQSINLYQFLFVSCCTAALPRYQCEQNVHNLISSNEDYNIAVPPIASYDEPLIVTTDIVYEYAEDINVMSGTATVFVTINLSWKDPRLAWTVENETTCADYINAWTEYGNQDTFIWGKLY